MITVGRDCSVGTATHYGLDGPVIEYRGRGGELFRTLPDRSLDPSGILYDGHRVFPGGKEASIWR